MLVCKLSARVSSVQRYTNVFRVAQFGSHFSAWHGPNDQALWLGASCGGRGGQEEGGRAPLCQGSTDATVSDELRQVRTPIH